MGLKYLHGSAVGRILSSLILSVDLLTKSSNVRSFGGSSQVGMMHLLRICMLNHVLRMVPTHRTNQELIN